jgi:hypothetical protein
MKKQISAFACGIAVLVWACAPVRAEFAGRLKRSYPWMLTFMPASTNTGDSSASVIYVYSNGTQEVIDGFIEQTGESTRVVYYKIPRGTRRIIIQVNPPENGSAKVNVDSGIVNDEIILNGDGQVVYEVVDEE